MGTIKLIEVKETVTGAVEAAVTQETEAPQETAPGVLYEEVERRAENSKVFKMNDGTAKQYVSDMPVHYCDASGRFCPIDNRFVEKDEAYEANVGARKTILSKDFSAGDVLQLTKGDTRLQWRYCKKQPSIALASVTDTQVAAMPVRVKSTDGPTQNKKLEQEAIYENIEPNVDLEYRFIGTNIKENIIVKEKCDDYRYTFKLNTEGLEVALAEDNSSIELYRMQDGNKVTEYKIPGPYMYDDANAYSDEVYYEMDKTGDNEYMFTVVADADWINAANRAFPVTVDPQIVTVEGSFFTKQVQYRNITVCGSGSGSGSGISAWYNTGNNYIKISKSSTMEYRTALTIRKSVMNLMDYPISSVKLIFKPYRINANGYFIVDASVSSINSNSAAYVNAYITSRFKSATGDFTVYAEPYNSFVDVEFYASGANAPVLEIDYLTKEKTRPVKQQFTLAGGLIGEYDVATGAWITCFNDVSSQDSVLGYGISHVFKQSGDDFHVGKNFRLNLNETLVKNSDSALDANYVYTDEHGDKHGFKDTYYYLDCNGTKNSIANKNDIIVELDGSLSYYAGGNKYEVKKEQRTTSGLTAVTKIEDFKNVELLEQRIDEVKQLEEKQESYRNTLEGMVLVNRDTGTLACSLKYYLSSYEIFENFMSYADMNNYLLLSKSEALQYRSLCVQQEELTGLITEQSIVPGRQNMYEQLLSLELNYYELNNKLIKYSSLFSDGEEYYATKQRILNALNNNQLVNKSDFDMMDENYNDYEFIKDNDALKMNGYSLQELFRQRNLALTQLNEQRISMRDHIILGNNQLTATEENAVLYRDQVREYYKEYVNVSEQLALYKRSLPVNYLTDGKIYKGFNEVGQLVAIYDGYENAMTVEYDDENKITCVYDGENKKIAFNYRPDGLLGSITDTRGRKINYAYDGEGRLTQVTYANGKSVTLGYSGTNEIQKILSSEYESTTVTKGANMYTVVTKSGIVKLQNGNVETQSDESAWLQCGSITLMYSYTGATITDNTTMNKTYYKIDADGNVSEYYEEENGKVTCAEKYELMFYDHEKTYHAKEDSLYLKGYSEFSIFDFMGGDHETVELDEYNNPKKQTVSARKIGTDTTRQVTTEYEYDENHKCVKEIATVTTTLPTGEKAYKQITAYNYNAAGNVVRKESYVEGEEYTTGKTVEETEYDENGNVVKSYTYNSLDTSSKFYTESAYAENGQVTADYDETGENKTEYEYISGTNVVRTQKLPNGGKLSYGHDEDDTVTSITQSTEEGEENSTQTHYTCGEITELVSGNNTVRYEYDHKRRVTAVHLNGTENYIANEYTDNVTYNNELADKTVTTNAKGEKFTSYTDKQGKILRTDYGEFPTLTYTYTTKGQLETIKDEISGKTINYTYENDKLATMTDGTLTEGNGYDWYGERNVKSFSGAVNHLYTYVYKDNVARDLDKIIVEGALFSPLKDKQGRYAGREISGGSAWIAGEYIYYRKVGDHATNMPSAVYFGSVENNKYVIRDNLKYEYDGCGNIVKIFSNGALAVRYGYDKLNRLIREDNKKFGKTWLYAYDNCGNIISKRETTFTLKTNVEESEFTEVLYMYDGDKLVGYGNETFAYDALGNPTTYRGKTASWSRGRYLMTYNGVSFIYDGQGRRTSKGIISYTYDSENNIVKQSNGLEFIYDTSGVAALKYNNAKYYYVKDAQGNICKIVDSAGNNIVQYTYDAWGNHKVEVLDPAYQTLANLNPFRYRGYYYDPETNLYYLKSRYYDPETGRFITIDDITVLSATQEYVNGLNLYSYCFNNPVNAVDEEGNMPKWLKWLIGGIAFVAAVVLTVISGGALAPVFIGMGVSILSGGVIQGAITAANGGNFWQGFLEGAADGALWGGIFALASAGIGAIRFTKGFRVMCLNEYDDIIKTGKFASDGFAEGKYLWTSKASAKTFAAKMGFAKGSYRIIAARISRSGLNKGIKSGSVFLWGKLDGIGKAMFIDINVVNQIVSRIWTVL